MTHHDQEQLARIDTIVVILALFLFLLYLAWRWA
jgi:hypothetical protein